MLVMSDEHKPDSDNWRAGRKSGIPLWFKLFALLLAGLLILKLLGLRVVVEVSYDGVPFLAALTDARIYFVPLFLILVYILLSWVWRKLFGPRDQE